MYSRMSKQECPAEKAKRVRRHNEESLRLALVQASLAHNAKILAGGAGVWSGRIDSVSCGPDLIAVTGDRFVAFAAARLLREAGLIEVVAYEHESGRHWVAAGLVRHS